MSKTYQTKTDMQKYPTINQTLVKYTFSGSQPATSGKWIKLGTWTSSGDTQCCLIQVFSGNGYNGSATQNSDFSIFIKDGYQAKPSASSAFGVTVTLGLNCANVKVQVRAKSNTVCDVWFYCPWAYGNGSYLVNRGSGKWENSGLNQTAEPTDGTSQSVSMADYLTSKETRSAITQTAESIKTTVSKEYATKTSLTQTANDLTIDFNSKINNIDKYVRFVDGNVILGEAGNPITLKLTNDHLDILSNANVVAKFAKNTIELGNDSYFSEIKLCKGLGSIQGYAQSGEDSNPHILIGASSGVKLYATREVNAGHLTTGGFNVLTSTDASNNTATMSSSSFLRGNNGHILKEAAVSVNTSNTGNSACDITASKIRINSRDVFTLTKLWSGNLSRGGSVNVTQGSQYTLFAVCPNGEGILMIGVKFKDELHCYASYDSGTESRQCRASFRVNEDTFRLTASSENVLNGANSGRNITEIYGLF